MRALLLAAALTLAAGCAGAPAAPVGPDNPARLYRAKCTSCHRAYAPASRSRAEWLAVMARMAPRAHLTAAEEERLRAWLAAGASDATHPEATR